MKDRVLLIGLLATGAALAGLPEGIEPSACVRPLKQRLKEWTSRDDWRRLPEMSPHGRAYRTPTHSLGVWLELRKTDRGALSLYRLAPTEVSLASWSLPGCELAFESRTRPALKDSPTERVFTDADLERLLATKKRGLIYAWSPSMAYSMRAHADIRKAATKIGLELLTLVDTHASRASVDEAVASGLMPREDRKIESIELLSRGISTHFPTTFVYADGKLAPVGIRGANRAAAFERLIARDLESLAKAR